MPSTFLKKHKVDDVQRLFIPDITPREVSFYEILEWLQYHTSDKFEDDLFYSNYKLYSVTLTFNWNNTQMKQIKKEYVKNAQDYADAKHLKTIPKQTKYIISKNIVNVWRNKINDIKMKLLHESHKDGSPHYHGFILDLDTNRDLSTLRFFVSQENPGFVKLDPIKSYKQLRGWCGYTTKNHLTVKQIHNIKRTRDTMRENIRENMDTDDNGNKRLDIFFNEKNEINKINSITNNIQCQQLDNILLEKEENLI